MNILITGNSGYIGPVLINYLKKKYNKYYLIGVDSGFFVQDLMEKNNFPERLFNIQYWSDVRNLSDDILQNVDAIIHLAAISNDPMGNKFEKVTQAINEEATVNLAMKAKRCGVKNFVFASSCSVYGSAGDGSRKEEDELNPLTAYARSKIGVEEKIKKFASSKFIVTSLRFATACGWSPRIRLDLVLNDFVAAAISSREIEILSDGSPWRPLIDVYDMTRAMDWAMHREEGNGGSYLSINVGSESWNYQVKELAEAVCDNIPNTSFLINTEAQPDKRSYKVDFTLFKKLAPEFQPIMTLDKSIKKIYEGLMKNNFNDNNFRESKYMRLNSLNYKITNKLLDIDLNWIV